MRTWLHPSVKVVVVFAVVNTVVDGFAGLYVANDPSSSVARRRSAFAGRHKPVHVEKRFGPHP